MIIEKKRRIKNKGRKVRKPREGYHPFELKYKAVQLYLEEGYTSKLIAAELGIGVSSISKWVKSYREEGEEGLRPKYPGGRGSQIASAVKEKAVDIKKANPEYGSRRISNVLKRMFCLGASPETVRKTLKEKDLIEPPKKKRKKNITRPRFFERATPNQLWQTDIFTFRLGGRNAYLLGYIDDYSRFITGMGLYRSQKADQLLETYRRAAAEYRVPKEMLTDNGRQYTNWRGTSRFEKELQKDRIKHIKSTPHHPMTLGKIERFWKTIFGEFLSRVQFDSFDEAQDRLKMWIKYYNYKRPHQGINGLCPADRFFEVQHEMRKVLSRGIEENVLEMALRGKPQKPFYMVGRWGDQSVVLHAEKGKVKMMVDGEECKEEKKMTYEIEEEVKDENKEQNNTDSKKEERTQDVHGQREMSGGTVDMGGAAQTSTDVQGDGDKLDTAGQLAEEGIIGNAESSGTEEEIREAVGPCVGSEAGEITGDNGAEDKPDESAGEAAGRDPGLEEEIIEDNQPKEGVIYLRKDQVPEILDLLRKWDAERIHHGAQENEAERGSSPVENETDNKSVIKTDDGLGSGEAAEDKPEDILQVGETGDRSDALSCDRQGLRATLVSGGWGEREHQEDGVEDAEEATYGRAEGDDTDIYG